MGEAEARGEASEHGGEPCARLWAARGLSPEAAALGILNPRDTDPPLPACGAGWGLTFDWGPCHVTLARVKGLRADSVEDITL